MTLFHSDPLVTLHHGDCLDVMPTLPAESVDATVTDPPYFLRFMGRTWDHAESPAMQQELHKAWATEAFRVAKPGAYLVSFGGTRTVHRLASALEDAGWEIRDMLMWVYASGFPKSLDVSKALDRVAGAEREVVGLKVTPDGKPYTDRRPKNADREGWDRPWKNDPDAWLAQQQATAPATDLARQWEGWGTALKPAHEPIILARKPLVGSVAANVTRYGTGALNIGATRIGISEGDGLLEWGEKHGGRDTKRDGEPYAKAEVMPRRVMTGTVNNAGRWPSNVLLDPDHPEIFDQANPWVVGSGATTASGALDRSKITAPNQTYGAAPKVREGTYEPDSGGYSRFFLIPKSPRHERERGLAGVDARRVYGAGKGVKTRQCRQCGSRTNPPGPEPKVWPACGHNDWEWVDLLPIARANHHPTVKPLDLMRHLVRLVCPPGGQILDPFAGSGTTGLAASEEGFRAILIEREREYCEIAVGRLMATPMGLGLDVPAPVRKRSGKWDDDATSKRKAAGWNPREAYGREWVGRPPSEDKEPAA